MPQITITFDNGPTLASTPETLDILAEHGVKATFFVVGEQMEAPEARRQAERAASEGHWIGNHGYTHSRTLGQFEDFEDSLAEITKCQDLIGDLAHRPDPLIRPYSDGGSIDERLLNPRALAYLEENGFTVVMFRDLAADWLGGPWPERALEQCGRHDHSLVVLHDRKFPEVNPGPIGMSVENEAAAFEGGLGGGSVPGLDRFLTMAKQAGFGFSQAHPDDCVPIRAGKPTGPLDHLVTAVPLRRSTPPFPRIEPEQLAAA